MASHGDLAAVGVLVLDLSVDLAAITHVAAQLDQAAATAEQVEAGHEGLPDHEAAAGRDDVANALDHFLGKWKYGCGLLGDDVKTLSKFLTMSAQAYRETDIKLGQLANPPGHK